MQITEEETNQYRGFIRQTAETLGCLQPPEGLIWHYTDGPGLIAILDSGCLHASQIAALNDKKETRYGSQLYLEAIKKLQADWDEGSEEHSLLGYIREALTEDPENPSHGSSTAYVCSFSGHRDELTQWERYGRKGQQPNWGYAIGFDRNLVGKTTLLRVIYSQSLQQKAAAKLASATLDFYSKGLSQERLKNIPEWRSSFFSIWDDLIYPLAAAVKDKCWESENEYRIYVDGRSIGLQDFGFKQRQSMLSRYVKLRPPAKEDGTNGYLPIQEIMIGPGNRPVFTRYNLQLLLEQKGYGQINISHSSIDIQNP